MRRPVVGDIVDFKYRGVFTGRIHAVAETGVHFMIEMPEGHKLRYRQVGLSRIIRIVSEEQSDGADDDEQMYGKGGGFTPEGR